MTLHTARQYQRDVIDRAFAAWASGLQTAAVVLPTGAGKSFVTSSIIERSNCAAVAIAHRSELVGQLSTALAREGIRHRVVGAETTRRHCAALHAQEFGRVFVDPNARVGVASSGTLVRKAASDPWFRQIGLWVVDECHHLIAGSQWDKCVSLFPNARGLGVTATPVRADGKGLGRQADGLMDTMIEGPSMRWMIDNGYLCDYAIACPKSDIDLAGVRVSSGGDYNPDDLKQARRRSHITGDAVQSYLKFARGKLALVFDTDLESAADTVAAFRAAGVMAECVSGDTPDEERAAALRRFRSKQTLVLVNVSLFGEGTDIPNLDCVIFARPTMSVSLYIQMWGRALRLSVGSDLMSRWETFTPAERLAHIAASDKPRAIIIDHVGNILRHGLADKPRRWSLDRRERASRGAPDDAIPLRSCDNPTCNLPYERVLQSCPYCGHTPVPAERSKPEQVDGVLELLDPSVLAAMRGEAERVMGEAVVPYGAPQVAQFAARKAHHERREAQLELRRLLALWGGLQSHLGRSDAEGQARFYHQYRIDVGTAQTLGAREANALSERITEDLTKRNVQL